MEDVTLQVSDAIGLINQTLDAAFPFILVEGEVSGFKINQGKFAFFDIKDDSGSLNCFMMAFQLKFPINDGMKVKVLAQPKITTWGKFSLTVREVVPVGEGSLKKSFEMLKNKLEAEGLFDETRKRLLPAIPSRIGVVSSSGAAGYADFIKILDNRWGSLEIVLVDVPVQGMDAPAQLIGAISYLNELSIPVDVLAIIRGGGSADDLSAFNHEDVVRAVASSRTPTIVGVGHEVDTSLSDLSADVRAATPSNAAELIVPDKTQIIQGILRINQQLEKHLIEAVDDALEQKVNSEESIYNRLNTFFEQKNDALHFMQKTLKQLDPTAVLKRGYSIIRKTDQVITKIENVTIGDDVTLQVSDGQLGARITNVS